MLDPRTNPAFLKLDLFCRGLRLDEGALRQDDGGRPVLRTRAGLGSGLELILPGGHHVNVPVVEPFAASSPYRLRRREGGPGGRARHEIAIGDEAVCEVRPAPLPSWYEALTSTGKPMRRVATLQGTVLAIYPSKVCEFWVRGPGRPERENCRFCSVGLNLGADDAPEKSVQEVIEAVLAARRESRVTYVDFNAGHADARTYAEMLEPYVRRVKEETGLLVGVQTPPLADPAGYERLRRMGVNRVSFCFEVFDPEAFRTLCPGKHRVYGQRGYFDAIERCASLAGGRTSAWNPWVTQGEIIAGLEDPESSVAAVEWLTSRGAVPTVCVFRPLVGTDLADRPPPRAEDLVPVFRALYRSCMEKGLPIGVAPNVKVSLVLLPEECAAFLPEGEASPALRRRERSLRRRARLFATACAARRGLARMRSRTRGALRTLRRSGNGRPDGR